jgi:hypothetical protein
MTEKFLKKCVKEDDVSSGYTEKSKDGPTRSLDEFQIYNKKTKQYQHLEELIEGDMWALGVLKPTIPNSTWQYFLISGTDSINR